MNTRQNLLVGFVRKAKAISRKAAHDTELECPLCTHFVKAINACKHAKNAHPTEAKVLQCTEAKSKLLATAS